MDNIKLDPMHNGIWIINQTLLPNEERTVQISTLSEMTDAIADLKVRGAPAIGIFAGYCIYVLAKNSKAPNREALLHELRDAADQLTAVRPTAVNLSWALKRMLCVVSENSTLDTQKLLELLYRECTAIHQEDREMCKAISEHGLTLLKDGDGILTHCNAGPLATSQYGTALGPILLGTEHGMHFKVFADETRPLLQGARLTAYELDRAGVDVTLICDNMASMVMKNGWVQACFVGCDRIAANGDTANKIGTNALAILAAYYHIPFYVLGPTSTVDFTCQTGADIKIEMRDPEEIRSLYYQKPMAPAGVKCYNPAFDVTDHTLITAIVTQHGICYPPYTESLLKGAYHDRTIRV